MKGDQPWPDDRTICWSFSFDFYFFFPFLPFLAFLPFRWFMYYNRWDKNKNKKTSTQFFKFAFNTTIRSTILDDDGDDDDLNYFVIIQDSQYPMSRGQLKSCAVLFVKIKWRIIFKWLKNVFFFDLHPQTLIPKYTHLDIEWSNTLKIWEYWQIQ